jgi:drug/metabolite transporter (DMT)-like permease
MQEDNGLGPPTLGRAGVYPLLGFLILILGVNWPFLAIGLREISPLWMSAIRLLIGALVVLAATALSGRLRTPSRRDLPVILSVGWLRLATVYVLVFTALQSIPPGRSSVLVWTASLWAVPIAGIFLSERMSRLRWLGLGLGIAGIVALVEPWTTRWSQPGVAGGHVLLIVAAIVSAGVSVHIRGHRFIATPLGLLPWQLLAATIPILTLALIREGLPSIAWTTDLVLIVIYQGLPATGLALWLQVSVLRSLPAVSTNLWLMLVPVVGLISSALILSEQITLPLMIGLALVFGGVGLNLGADRQLDEI